MQWWWSQIDSIIHMEWFDVTRGSYPAWMHVIRIIIDQFVDFGHIIPRIGGRSTGRGSSNRWNKVEITSTIGEVLEVTQVWAFEVQIRILTHVQLVRTKPPTGRLCFTFPFGDNCYLFFIFTWVLTALRTTLLITIFRSIIFLFLILVTFIVVIFLGIKLDILSLSPISFFLPLSLGKWISQVLLQCICKA